MEWQQISVDPNAKDVLAARQHALDTARDVPVVDRVEYLVGLARDRRVLDIGVVEHDIGSATSQTWLHRQLADVARSCLGVDVLTTAIDELHGRGYNVMVHDITTGPLPEQFDLIVAGEVIEHLGAPQALFQSAGPMLAEGGRLVLTTPNPYMLHRAWRGVRDRFRDSADHIALFSPAQLYELAERSGFCLQRWRGVQLKLMRDPRNLAIGLARRALSRTALSREADCDTLIYEFGLVPR